MAKEKNLEAMRLFRTSTGISSQLMFLRARENSIIIQLWLQALDNEKLKLRK